MKRLFQHKRGSSARSSSELLDEVADYILSNGLADLSLRPLATAIDTSPRMLLYFFGSKERLILEALGGIRAREQIDFKRAVSKPRPADRLEFSLRDWRSSASPRNEKYSRLFFEVYGLALQNPREFPVFLEGPSVIGCRCSSKHLPPLVFPLRTLKPWLLGAQVRCAACIWTCSLPANENVPRQLFGKCSDCSPGCAIAPEADRPDHSKHRSPGQLPHRQEARRGIPIN